jgi:hypothetical protein
MFKIKVLSSNDTGVLFYATANFIQLLSGINEMLSELHEMCGLY